MTQRYFLLVLLLWCYCAQAQYFPLGSPIISHFEKSDYRAGTQNWAVLQDERGIMYFGNNKGLLEFDGTNWRTFRLPNSTIVRSLAIDSEGIIYIGGQNEFGYLSADDAGNGQYISLTDLIPTSQRNFTDVWKIIALEDAVFFCSQQHIFKYQNKTITLIDPGDRFENFFHCGNEFYVQDTRDGLLRWEEHRLVPLQAENEIMQDRITAILPYANEQKLVVSATQGLYLLTSSGLEPWNVPISGFLTTHRTYCATALYDGNFAIGTIQDGLVIIDRLGNPVLHLNQRNGLQNNTVLSMYEDTHHNLWLGLDNGIDYVENSAPFSNISDEVGVEGAGYTSIVHDNRLYLGTNQGLYYLDWPQSDNPLVPGQFQAVEGIKGQVWSLRKLGDDLIAGLHEGAYQIKNNRLFPLSEQEGAWRFLQLEQQPLYALEGTYSGLLLYQRTPTDAAADWNFLKELSGFDESARVMEEDENGHIWVSHAYKGLYRIELDVEQGLIQAVAFYDTTSGLPSNININVAKIRNELVFTSPNGIFRYAEAQDRFVPHEELNEIFGPEANVHRLLEDQNGNLWFSVDNSLGLIMVKEKGVFNEIEKVYFNQLQEKIMSGFEHVYAHDDNNVFIATETGFIHYDPSRKKDFELPYQTIIRQVTSIEAGDSVIYGGGAPGQGSIIQSAAEFRFPPNFNDFRFSYAAPYYEQINHIEYRYRLEGFQEEWSVWSPLSSKEYTNLPAGEYRFLVEARNAYAQTSTADSFSFSIRPKWIDTYWAKALFLTLFILFLLGMLWYFHRKTQQQEEELKQEQARTLQQKEAAFQKEVEKSEAEIIRLRNEKLRGDIKHKDSQLAAATMHLVQKGEMLNTIKQELNKLLSNANPENKQKVKKLIRTIVADARLDDNWEQFEFHFDQVHENFMKRLREQYPMLTPKDQKLCAYLRMNLSTKEIAPLMNISVRGVEISRYRLRKKLQIDSDTNLIDFMVNF